jgi:hypothetical protein
MLRDVAEIVGALTEAGAPLGLETSPTTTPRELLTALESKLASG